MDKRFPRAFALLVVLILSGCASGALDDDEFLYAGIGASDAVGIGALPPTDGYVFQIESDLEAEGKTIDLIVLGIPGAVTSEINELTQTFLRTGAQPALATVWVGANDIRRGISPSAFEDELDDLLSALREETDAFIVIANIPDLTKLPRFEDDPDADVTIDRVNDYNDVIAELADTYAISIVDLFAEDIEDDLVSSVDGFHPSNEGHAFIANLFLEVIRPEL